MHGAHGTEEWAKWADTVDATFDRALDSVRQAKRLLDPANLRPVLRI